MLGYHGLRFEHTSKLYLKGPVESLRVSCFWRTQYKSLKPLSSSLLPPAPWTHLMPDLSFHHPAPVMHSYQSQSPAVLQKIGYISPKGRDWSSVVNFDNVGKVYIAFTIACCSLLLRLPLRSNCSSLVSACLVCLYASQKWVGHGFLGGEPFPRFPQDHPCDQVMDSTIAPRC